MRALVACALFLPFLPFTALSQSNAKALHPLVKRASPQPSTDSLRVTHVSLYKNGVGFFEHEGIVDGDASVSLDLTSAQLNDVLQSLTALDLGGGHITGAHYNSTTPLDTQLRTLPFSLGEQPSEDDLFSTLRGARVQVSGSGAPFTGRILALEIRPGTPASDEPKQPEPEQRFLTVVADTGATRTLRLGSDTVVHLLDNALRTDLNTYLQLLDAHRSEGTRHLLLTDHGEGRRALHVSFLSEVPVWKSTYRFLLTTPITGNPAEANQTATVQGFSVIDNTTGEDWNNVQLSLIAGSPQSFLQPLSQPIYDRRPEIPIAENAQTTPQTHESADGEEPPPPGSASADLGSGSGGVPASLFGSPTGTGSGTGGPVVALASPNKIPKNISMMKDAGPSPPPTPTMVPHAATASPEMIEQSVRNSTQANATTAAFDDFFAYNLIDPVTIPRNGSALVPILQARLPVENVTLWSTQSPQPLRALWLTNDSNNTLDRGSFSLVENGAFAGEGLLDPVHPGERRLLSYAVDQAVRVSRVDSPEASRITGVLAAKGVLTVLQAETNETTYTVDNAAPATRTVILEEPHIAGWTLSSAATPAETTPQSDRFRLVVQPHAAAHLVLRHQQTTDQEFRLLDTLPDQLTIYLEGNGADPRILAALEPIFQARRKLTELDTALTALRGREHSISDDQQRLRGNLAALKNSAEERALVRRYSNELNAQEDTLAGLHRDLATLQTQRSAAADNLSHLIESLQINTASRVP